MTNTNPKISIIVPIFNAGSHLKPCLDSLINQSLNDIEIILVLDCPTDGSDVIAKQYADTDKRIVIIENKKNMHIGNSRNIGLSIACGEYIGFSDHDDYRSLNMYEELWKVACNNNSDIVMSLQYDEIDDISDVNNYIHNTKETLLQDLLSFGARKKSGAQFVNVTSNIYRNKNIKDKKIQFVDTVYITPEDLIFQIEIIQKSDKINFVSERYYHHQKHELNEGNNKTYTSYIKRSAGVEYIYNFLLKESIYEKYKLYFQAGAYKQFIMSLSGTLLPYPKIIQFVKAVLHLRKYTYTNEIFKSNEFKYLLPSVKHHIFRNFLVYCLKS